MRFVGIGTAQAREIVTGLGSCASIDQLVWPLVRINHEIGIGGAEFGHMVPDSTSKPKTNKSHPMIGSSS